RASGSSLRTSGGTLCADGRAANPRRLRAGATAPPRQDPRALDTSLAVFLCVYAAMILGGVPGLRLDRPRAALVGAVVLGATGALSRGDAWRAIDVGTIGLLLGVMLVSAQFRLGGFYGSVTRWLASRPTSPERLLLELVLVTGVLAALLTNDVV